MQSNGYPGLTVSELGFVDKCWLGASPDAWVIVNMAEFKCPYREAEMSVEEACKRFEFCCSMADDMTSDRLFQVV